MSLNYLLSDRDYSIYNALNWGNCLNHARLAWTTETPYTQRFFHGAVAVVEMLPIVGQVASLFEMAIASILKPSYADLTKRKIRQITAEVLNPVQNAQPIVLHNPSSDEVDIELSSNICDLRNEIFPLHRQIERIYGSLPWPETIQKITVLTEVKGGRGDIAAAAKGIALMQKLCPTLHFDWVLEGESSNHSYDPMSFLNCNDPSKIHVRYYNSQPLDKTASDLLFVGPVKFQMDKNYAMGLLQREVSGPIFGFIENGGTLKPIQDEEHGFMKIHAKKQAYDNLHRYIFPSTSGNNNGLLPMGIQEGTGVFLDKSRIEAHLSRNYCCPTYISQIQDADLRQDILQAMNIFDGVSEPDYDQHSLNSGYAHHASSWEKFIDCVAIHEKNKHVIIVLNQNGEDAKLTTDAFQDQIFTKKRLEFLKEKGYGTVILKGKGKESALLQEAQNPELERRLIVIVRPFFHPNDMRCLQLASERLLSTGDNSAVESLCARCKLYLYEDVANFASCKWKFLQQQVDLAKVISPNLSKLLALFGGDRRLDPKDRFLNKPLNSEKMQEMESLLNDPELSDATLQFCDLVIENYSFDTVLECALKRTLWHHCIPELAEIEAMSLSNNLGPTLCEHIQHPESQIVRINTSALSKQIQETVHTHLENNR